MLSWRCPGRRVPRCLHRAARVAGRAQPHVLACAALLPDLVTAAASLASLAPYGAEGLDWFDGMGELNVEDFKLYERDPVASRAKLEADREEMLAASPAEEAKIIESLLTPTDAAVFTGELGDYLSYTGHEGLAPGPEGWWEDGVAQSGPWVRPGERCCARRTGA